MFSFNLKHSLSLLTGNRICITFFNYVRAYCYICIEAITSDNKFTGLIFNEYHKEKDGVL